MDKVAFGKNKKIRMVSSALVGLAATLVLSAGAAATPGQIASLQVPGIQGTSHQVDLVALETKISNTDAINFIAKIKLKNGIDSLTSEFDQFHNGQSNNSLGDLRRRFDEFLFSTVAMLRNGDPTLADELVMSRDALWKILTDPKKEWPNPTEP